MTVQDIVDDLGKAAKKADPICAEVAYKKAKWLLSRLPEAT